MVHLEAVVDEMIAVWTLRTCAVYNNNKWLFGFFGALGSTVAIMLIVSTISCVSNSIVLSRHIQYRTPFMRCSGQKDLSK